MFSSVYGLPGKSSSHSTEIHRDPSPFFFLGFVFIADSSVRLCLTLPHFACAPRPVTAPKSLLYFPEFICLVFYFLPPPSTPPPHSALPSAHSAGTLLASLLCSLHLGGGWRRKDATSPLVKLDGAINSPEVWLAARWLQPSFHSANGSGGGERAGLRGGGGGAVNENQTLEMKWPMFRGNEAHVGGGPFYAH